MPGTASFSSVSTSRTLSQQRQQQRSSSSIIKNPQQPPHTEAGVFVWDCDVQGRRQQQEGRGAATKTSDEARRRRSRTESAVSRHQREEEVQTLSPRQQQLLLSALLQDLSFWEASSSSRQISHEAHSLLPKSSVNSLSDTRIPASDHQEGGMLSSARSGLLSRNGQRVAAVTDDGGDHGSSSNKKSDMHTSSFGAASNQPLRRNPSAYGDDEEKKVETPAGNVNSELPAGTDQTASKPVSGRVWKTAVDPSTGRTYYYDAATRQTQWEKPEEVRAEERRIKKEKRRLEQIFFEEVRANVLASLARGELIPGIPRNETRSQGPPIEPVLSPANSSASLAPTSPPTNESSPPIQQQQRGSSGSSNARIRTISGMNEKLLAELHNPPPSTASYVVAARPNSSRIPHPVTTSTASATAKPAVPSAVAATTVPPTNEGRPPLPRGRSLTIRDDRATGVVPAQQPLPSSLRQPNDRYFSTQDSLDLSPDPVDNRKRRTPGPTEGLDADAVDSAAGAGGDTELDGERLLDGPIFGGDVATSSASSSATANTLQKGGDGSTSTSSLSTSSHMRRNTGVTVFFQSTMENPNINATIKCVCGVYRAHIMSSSAAAASTSVSSRDKSSAAAFEIFRDETHRDYRRITSQNTASHSQPVPSLHEIETFYMDFYRRSQMEQDTIIMSLIYVERLIKETNGALTPSPSNWKSILFSCMVLSSKVWDDLSMFNLDFSNVSMAVSSSRNAAGGAAPTAPAPSSSLSSFSLQRTNALEVALLQTLNFNVRVAASEYAKYYFLIRTMLLRSGLLDESNGSGGGSGSAAADAKVATTTGALNPDDGQRLENRSSLYQDQLQRRAKSVDWTFRSAESMSEPVLKDSVCLEQVLAGQRS